MEPFTPFLLYSSNKHLKFVILLPCFHRYNMVSRSRPGFYTITSIEPVNRRNTFDFVDSMTVNPGVYFIYPAPSLIRSFCLRGQRMECWVPVTFSLLFWNRSYYYRNLPNFLLRRRTGVRTSVPTLNSMFE